MMIKKKILEMSFKWLEYASEDEIFTKTEKKDIEKTLILIEEKIEELG